MKTRLVASIIIVIAAAAGLTYFAFYAGVIGGTCVEGKNLDGTCKEPPVMPKFVEDKELQPKDGVLTKVDGLQYESPEELAYEFVKFFDDEIVGIAH